MAEQWRRTRGARRRCSSYSLFFFAVCAAILAVTANAVNSVSGPPTRNTDQFLPTEVNGPIDDAHCNMEELEEANDSQLYSILHELSKTAMFRNFIVDLEPKCPLASWSKGGGSEIDDETSFMEDEDEYVCTGGAEDLEEDDEPLCSVEGGDPLDPFANPFDSNALTTLSQEGFQSRAQQDTFAWKQHSDVIVSDDTLTEECDEDGFLPDSFWLDMCSNIHAGEGSNVVNLMKNLERNTGYDGTHIWKAIYEENCVTKSDGDDSDMCLEERVLYRLLSGLHTSTTISIAMNYYPPSVRKGRADWEPNPQYFMEKFQGKPDYIRNLHFAYVVTLRALQKASPYLYNYEIRTGDIVEDETATVLLKRLLDSGILKSCSNIFSAFDESIMFQESNLDVVSLQQNFKGVFHNVSSILDCVQCQQCKLHGKMAMLGYGTALKILFVKNPENLALERNEIVALINTVAKLSESIRHVRELTNMFVERQEKVEKVEPAVEDAKTETVLPPTTPTLGLGFGDDQVSLQLFDMAIGLVSSLGKNGKIPFDREVELVELALARNPDLLILVKYYGDDQGKFLEVSRSLSWLGSIEEVDLEPDAIIIGSGLAGLSAALNILDRGGRVILIEKEHMLGGNSNKASSGINAYNSVETTDSLETFYNDTYQSAGTSARQDLIETLVSKSADAVAWLKNRVGVDLSLVAQLGGHSAQRTHRPSNGMAGSEIIYGIQKAVRAYEKTGEIKILVDTRVSRLLATDGSTTGVEYVGADGQLTEIHAPNVVLATGGFAADRSTGSFLEHYRPELLQMATTAGNFSTGDGIALATALGANTVDMDKVQIHPTGWIDPVDPENTSKTLAAELMRGVGGILLNDTGARFCNELGTRAYVTEQMLSHNPIFAKEGVWDAKSRAPTFNLILSSSAAEAGKKHVDLYSHKGLMTRLEGVAELARWMGLPKATVVSSLQQYQKVFKKGVDEFGKTAFQGVPDENLETEIFYAGKVTPVLHYCMGGITIDKEGNVLSAEGNTIPGLHAAGEVAGGVHGVNRLGGNSLLECTVYGTIVGQKIPVKVRSPSRPGPSRQGPNRQKPSQPESSQLKKPELRSVSYSELQKHNTPEDCWVAINNIVYDLTEFVSEHPSGPESIYELAGKDGTKAFSVVHNERMLEDFIDEQIGTLEPGPLKSNAQKDLHTLSVNVPAATSTRGATFAK
jgi:flavocytochrome c